MNTRSELIEYCLGLPGAYEDYPFHDFNWTLMRHSGNQKSFAAIFEHMGQIWVNLKCEPDVAELFRAAYPGVVLPAYHMDKRHWNSVIPGDGISDEDLRDMILRSYELTK